MHSLVAGFRPANLILARRIAFPLLVLGSGLMLVQPCASAPFVFEGSGSWTPTGNLATKRQDHTATLLPNGKVLIAGGYNSTSGYLASAELYDPASGIWTAAGSLVIARQGHTATLLPNGTALVAGGNGGGKSAELYDPATGTWTATGRLATTRYLHTATLLPNGKVLVAGGYNFTSGELGSAELYDVGLGFSSDWQPMIDHWKLTGGKRLMLKGSLFQGISQAPAATPRIHRAITRSCSCAVSITARLLSSWSLRSAAGRTQASLLARLETFLSARLW
jgi:WD40 repeat protein